MQVTSKFYPFARKDLDKEAFALFVKILRTNHHPLPGNNTSSKTNILKKKALRISLILKKKTLVVIISLFLLYKFHL